MQKKRNNKKLIAGFAAVLAVMVTVAATFAWFQTKDSAKNHLETALIDDGSVSVFELFDKEGALDWKPGQAITKNVAVVNSSAGDILVRVSLEEILSKLLSTVKNENDTPVLPTGEIRVPYNAPTNGGSWTAIAPTDVVAGTIPSGVAILQASTEVKQSDGTSFSPKKYLYEFTAYYTYTDIVDGESVSKQQQLLLKDGAVTVDENYKFIIDDTKIKYATFGAKITEQFDWAGEHEHAIAAPAVNVANNPAITYGSPSRVGLDPLIKINYSTSLKASMTVNNWWYNEADGYFYYIGAVTSGMTTPNLIDSLVLDSTANAANYQMMDFDLFIEMEALQNTKDAVAAVWGLATADPLYTQLSGYCVY